MYLAATRSIRPVLLAIIVGFPSNLAQSEEFGISDERLVVEFREEAIRIIEEKSVLGKPKSLKGKKGFDLLQEAYRADPAATLDLIRRILDSGTKLR